MLVFLSERSIPSTISFPSLIGSRSLIVRMRVDFPEPEGPQTTTTSPARDLEVDVVQHVQRAEPFVDVLEPDHRASPGIFRAAESLPLSRGCKLYMIRSPSHPREFAGTRIPPPVFPSRFPNYLPIDYTKRCGRGASRWGNAFTMGRPVRSSNSCSTSPGCIIGPACTHPGIRSSPGESTRSARPFRRRPAANLPGPSSWASRGTGCSSGTASSVGDHPLVSNFTEVLFRRHVATLEIAEDVTAGGTLRLFPMPSRPAVRKDRHPSRGVPDPGGDPRHPPLPRELQGGSLPGDPGGRGVGGVRNRGRKRSGGHFSRPTSRPETTTGRSWRSSRSFRNCFR